MTVQRDDKRLMLLHGDSAPVGELWVKDESGGPTGTFKDRLAQLALATVEGGTHFASISYGNTALAFARAVAHASDQHFTWLIPSGFDRWILGPDTHGFWITGADMIDVVRSLGASLVEVELERELLDDAAVATIASSDTNRRGVSFLNVTEGLDEPAYESICIEALRCLPGPPDVVVVQYGAGILSDEVRDVVCRLAPTTMMVSVSTPNPRSVAVMLYGPMWLDIGELRRNGVTQTTAVADARSVSRRSSYPVYRLEEEDIHRGLAIARAHGLSAEPSGAACLGFVRRLSWVLPNIDLANARVLVINTGNGIAGCRTICAELSEEW